MKEIKPLPNLDYKIVVGNSLLGVDLEHGQMTFEEELLRDLEEEKHKEFNETDFMKKKEHKKKIDNLIGDLTNGRQIFDFKIYFSEVFHRQNVENVKKLYHITWVTHNSRVSERMIEYEAVIRRLRINKGLQPLAEPILLNEEDEVELTGYIRDIVLADHLQVLAYNICEDHVHLVLVCEEDQRDNIVRKLKGKSTQNYKVAHGIKDEFHLWAQKYSWTIIKSEEQLNNTLHYIQHNREKHQLPVNKGLQPLVAAMVSGAVPCNKGLQPLVTPLVTPLAAPLVATPFSTSAGFDVVIGNPPYIRQEKIKEYKADLKKMYQCYTGVADIYVFFYERGLNLLRKKGVLAYITSNKYMRAGYGEKLRKYLTDNARILHLIDFGDAPVFEATAYPSILILQREKSQNGMVNALSWQSQLPVSEFERVVKVNNFFIAQKDLTSDGWRLESPISIRLLEKLRSTGKPLGEFVNNNFFRGIVSGLNKAFIIDRITRDQLIAEHSSSTEILKPFLRGRDVKRWQVDSQDLWLIFTRRGLDIKKYPAVQNHLYNFKSELTPGVKGGRKPGKYQWYEIQDNIAYWQEFEQPKIIYPDIAKKPEFAYDISNYYLDSTLFLIPVKKNGLEGLLNSNVLFWFYTKISSQIRGMFVRFKSLYVSQIPIATGPQLDRIEKVVNQIQSLNKIKYNADVSQLEQEINHLVYELYGLTKDEIKIIEEQNEP